MTTEEISQFPNETKRINETDTLMQKVDALAIKLMEEENDLQFTLDISTKSSQKRDAFIQGFVKDVIQPSLPSKTVVASIMQMGEDSLSFKLSPKYQMIVIDAILKAIRIEQADMERVIIKARNAEAEII
jgi:hypothetical protein